MDFTRLAIADRELTPAELTMLEETALAVAQATIQNAINEAELTRADVARRMGCPRSYVTRILQGDHNLTIKTLARALGACGQQVQLEATEPQCQWAVLEQRLSIEHDLTWAGSGFMTDPPMQQLAIAP